MKIKIKVGLFFVFLGIFSATLFVYVDYFLQKNFKNQLLGSIHLLEEKNISTYRSFINGLKQSTINWSSDPRIQELAAQIVDPALSLSRRNAAAYEFEEYLVKKKMRYDSRVILAEVLDQNGIVVASSRPERIGVDEYKEELELQAHHFSKTITANFGEAFVRSVVFEEDESPEPMFHVTTRLFRPEFDLKKDPVPLPAVLLVHFVSLPQLAGFLRGGDNLLEDGSNFSLHKFETMETYLVSKDRIIVTPTRFVKDLSKKISIATKPVEECFLHGKGVAEEYLDYRGTPVIGTSACILEDGLLLINEIETAEAYAPFKELMRKTIVVGGVILVILTLIVFLILNRFLKRLKLIAVVAQEYSMGNFSRRVSTISKDEIGQLASTFNTMLEKIEVSQKEIKQSEEKLYNDAIILEKDLKEHEEQAVFLEQSKKATLNLLEDAWQAKERLQFESRRLQAVIASIGEGLVLIDNQHKITLVNPKILELTGMSLEELMGKDLRILVKLLKKKKGEMVPVEWPTEEMFLTKNIVIVDLEDELALVTEKRTVALPVAFSAAPIEGGNGGVIVIRDVTEDRALDDAKSGFISVASHQLRTPLTTIRWYSEMLLSEDVGVFSQSQREFLEEIHGGAERLYQTIDLLLGISRVESGKIKSDPVPINLALFSENIAHELAPQADLKKLSLQVIPPEGEVIVSLDMLTLRQVILNLFSNAIRYTNDGGIIEARWSVGGDGKEVIYSVHDNGIGIPVAQRSRIFSKFFRAENALSKVPDGSGLGLALVKELVEAWGGKVWFETTEGQGTTFFFTIPFENQEKK